MTARGLDSLAMPWPIKSECKYISSFALSLSTYMFFLSLTYCQSRSYTILAYSTPSPFPLLYFTLLSSSALSGLISEV